MRALLIVLALAGCGDNGGSPDLAPDLAEPVDLSGADFSGIPSCLDINNCVQGKQFTPPMPCKNSMCVTACGMKATQASRDLYFALQSCFDQNCPKASDMAAPICAGVFTGMPSQDCLACVADTIQADTSKCTSSVPTACRACYAQAQMCITDTM